MTFYVTIALLSWTHVGRYYDLRGGVICQLRVPVCVQSRVPDTREMIASTSAVTGPLVGSRRHHQGSRGTSPWAT
jgi:hypothetical protein